MNCENLGFTWQRLCRILIASRAIYTENLKITVYMIRSENNCEGFVVCKCNEPSFEYFTLVSYFILDSSTRKLTDNYI